MRILHNPHPGPAALEESLSLLTRGIQSSPEDLRFSSARAALLCNSNRLDEAELKCIIVLLLAEDPEAEQRKKNFQTGWTTRRRLKCTGIS